MCDAEEKTQLVSGFQANLFVESVCVCCLQVQYLNHTHKQQYLQNENEIGPEY